MWGIVRERRARRNVVRADIGIVMCGVECTVLPDDVRGAVELPVEPTSGVTASHSLTFMDSDKAA